MCQITKYIRKMRIGYFFIGYKSHIIASYYSKKEDVFNLHFLKSITQKQSHTEHSCRLSPRFDGYSRFRSIG